MPGCKSRIWPCDLRQVIFSLSLFPHLYNLIKDLYNLLGLIWANLFLSRYDYSYCFPPHPLRGEDSCQLSSMIPSLCFAGSQPRVTAWEKSGQGVWDLSMGPRDCLSQGDLCKGRRSVLEKFYSALKMSSLQNHTYENGYNEKDWPNQALARMWSKGNSHALLLEM